MKKYLLALPLVLMPVSPAMARSGANRDNGPVQSRLSGVSDASLQDRIIAAIAPEPTYHGESDFAEFQPRLGSKESEMSLQVRIADLIANNYHSYSNVYSTKNVRSDHPIDLQTAIMKSILGR